LSDLLQLEVWHLLHGVVKCTNFRLMDIFIHHIVAYYDLRIQYKKLKCMSIFYN
jgi:hypothetical protein